MITRGKLGISKPNLPFIGTVTTTPDSTSSALQNPVWFQAMKQEYSASQKNQTWSLVPKSPHMNVIGSKWVFKIKNKADGTIDRYKARLMAKGFIHTPGIDLFDTYSPVIKPSTVRLLLTLVVSLNWPVHQLYINNSFLNGILKEIVYMSQPEGFVNPTQPTHVCKLNKAM